MAAEVKKVNKKVYTGLVVSDKMDKTVVVRVEGKKLHPLYKKYISNSKKFKAHDEKNEANQGDTVRIEEARPVSKDKCWRLVQIIERAR